MSAEWYYKVMGVEIGPLSAAQLRQHAQDGKLAPDMHVRRGDGDRWVSAETVKGLFEKPSSQASKPVPSSSLAMVESQTRNAPAPPSTQSLVPPIQSPQARTSSSAPTPPTLPSRRIIVGGIALFAVSIIVVALVQFSGVVSAKIKISDVFREQLMKYLESSGELEAATEQGVNILTMKQHLAKVKSSHELLSATWPKGFEPDASRSFDKAVEGWELAVQLWAARSADLAPPTEPNVNGYAQYMAYAGDALETDTWRGGLVEQYEGKRRIRRSDKNVGVFLTIAAAHSKAGKGAVLAALSDN